MTKIPPHFQGILWSIPLNKIDLARDKTYLIHQVLMYGNLKDVRWLFKAYPKDEIKKVFLNKPQKVYTPQAFNFTKNYILDLKNKKISPKNYINAIHKYS